MLPAILSLLTQIAGMTSEASVVEQIVQSLVGLIPTLIQEYKDLVPVVKNIISALQANPATTAEQMVTLKALDAKCDADFDTAADAADAADAGSTNG